LLTGYKLRIEENCWVYDLLEEHEDIKGGAKVSLMSGLCQLLHVEDGGGRGEETGGHCRLYLKQVEI